MTDRVRVEPLARVAEHAIESGWVPSWTELAADVLGRPDSSQLKRLLGLQPGSEGAVRTHIEYERAVRIVRAIPNIDPVDVGI